MQSAKYFLTTVAFAVTCLSASSAGAATDSSKPSASQNTSSQPTSEARKQMAAIHSQMAECLNSNKPIQDCRDQMRSSMKSLHAQYGTHCCGNQAQMGGTMGPHGAGCPCC